MKDHHPKLLKNKDMPLTAPKKVPRTLDWQTVREDSHFLLQKNSKKKSNFRILLKCNDYQIGEFSSEKDMLKEWAFLHPKEAEDKFDEMSNKSSNALLEEIINQESLNSNVLTKKDQTEQSEYISLFLNIKNTIENLKETLANSTFLDFTKIIMSLISVSRQLLLHAKYILNIKYMELRMTNIMKENEWVLVDPPKGNIKESQEADMLTLFDSNEENLDIAMNEIKRNIEAIKEIHKKQIITSNLMLNSLINGTAILPENSVAQNMYFIPFISKTIKASDEEAFIQIEKDLKEGILSLDEIEEKVYEAICLHISIEGSPLSLMFDHVSKALNNQLRILILSEEVGVNFVEKFKDELLRIASICTSCLKLTISALNIDTLYDIFESAIYDMILAKSYTTLMVVLTNLNKEADDMYLSKCSVYSSNLTQNTFGMCDAGWKLVNNETLFKDKCLSVLQSFSEEYSLRKKFQCISLLIQNICDATAQISKGQSKNIGTDQLIPILCHTIITSKTRKLISHLSYLQAFSPPSTLLGKLGFLLVSMETSAQVIIKLPDR